MPSARTSGWHWLIAALAIFSFLFVMGTAATHVHADAAADTACLVCATVDQVAQLQAAPTLAAPLFYVQIFRLPSASPVSLLPASASLIPPSCGPPPVLS